MIISHKYKFIFIAIPKTGTHAIRFAMRPYLDETDVEHVNLFVQKRSPFPEFNQITHGHMTCRQVRDAVGTEIWNSYFKFAIVRNPFDRFISYCSFIHRHNSTFHAAPQKYLYHALLDKQTHKRILFQPQSHFILGEQDQPLTDYTGQYESLDESFRHICSATGMPYSELQKINASERRNYQEYYNKELINLVRNHYHQDLQFLNYTF